MKRKYNSIYFILIFTTALACNSNPQKNQENEVIENKTEKDTPISEDTLAIEKEIPTTDPEDNKIYSVVEEMPLFSGRTNYDSSRLAIQQFIAENLEYPKLAKDNGVEGVVLINFIVNKDSTLSNFIIMKDIGANCGGEAIRVAQSMNEQGIKWTPGKHRGKIVKVKYHLPVRFKLY